MHITACPCWVEGVRFALWRISPAAFATERDDTVSLKNPSENEAQRMLEKGTQALEDGDLEQAKVRRRRAA